MDCSTPMPKDRPGRFSGRAGRIESERPSRPRINRCRGRPVSKLPHNIHQLPAWGHRWAHPLAVAPTLPSAWPFRVPPLRVSADPPWQSGRRSATRANRPPIPAVSPAVPGPAPHSGCSPARPPAAAAPNWRGSSPGLWSTAAGRPSTARAPLSPCRSAGTSRAARRTRRRSAGPAPGRTVSGAAAGGLSPIEAAATCLRERTLVPELLISESCGRGSCSSGMRPRSWSGAVATGWLAERHASSVSNLSTLRVCLLNSTPTRCTGTPRWRYLSA